MIYVVLFSLFLLTAIIIIIGVHKYRGFTKFERNFRIARSHATSQDDAARRQHGRNQILSLVQSRVEGIKRSSEINRKDDVKKTARVLIGEVKSPAEFTLLVTNDSEQEIKTWYTNVRKSIESLLPTDSARETCNRCGETYFSDLSDPDSKELFCTWCELKPPTVAELEFRPDTPQRIRDLFIFAYTHPPVTEFRDLQLQISESDLCQDDNPQAYPGVHLDYDGSLRVTAAMRRKYSVEQGYGFSAKPCLIKHGFSIEESPNWLLNAWKRYKNTQKR